MDRGRRKALMALGKFFCLGMSGWIFVCYDKLQPYLSQRLVEIEDLFPWWPDVQVVPGSHHPVYGYHSDVRIALEQLTPLLRVTKPLLVRELNELPSSDLARDLLLIGGPVANAISLKVHGYQYSGKKISVDRVEDTGLRWSFHYPYKTDDDPSYSRYVDGRLEPKMPKALVDHHASAPLAQPRYCPIDSHTGRIRGDYLLVTVVPNKLTSYSTGSTIIDVADLQGQGDKVFPILLDDSHRGELAGAVKGKSYYQALYEVAVKHDDEFCVTFPGPPRLIDVHILG